MKDNMINHDKIIEQFVSLIKIDAAEYMLRAHDLDYKGYDNIPTLREYLGATTDQDALDITMKFIKDKSNWDFREIYEDDIDNNIADYGPVWFDTNEALSKAEKKSLNGKTYRTVIADLYSKDEFNPFPDTFYCHIYLSNNDEPLYYELYQD